MKFDIVVGNPPYKDGLHLKFLEDAIKKSDRFIIIEPASFLINEKPNKNNTIEKRMKKALQGNVYRIEIRNPNKIFKDAKLATPISIIYYDKTKEHSTFILKDYMRNEEWEMSNIDDINKYGNNPIYRSIKRKVEEYIKKNGSMLDIKNRDGKYYINFSQIRGNISKDNDHMWNPDFFTFVPNGLKVSEKKEKSFSIGFDLEEKADNALMYLRLKIPRFCLSIFKIHNNIDRGELGIIPLIDFSNKLEEEDLKKEFDFNREEFEFIIKNIPDY